MTGAAADQVLYDNAPTPVLEGHDVEERMRAFTAMAVILPREDGSLSSVAALSDLSESSVRMLYRDSAEAGYFSDDQGYGRAREYEVGKEAVLFARAYLEVGENTTFDLTGVSSKRLTPAESDEVVEDLFYAGDGAMPRPWKKQEKQHQPEPEEPDPEKRERVDGLQAIVDDMVAETGEEEWIIEEEREERGPVFIGEEAVEREAPSKEEQFSGYDGGFGS